MLILHMRCTLVRGRRQAMRFQDRLRVLHGYPAVIQRRSKRSATWATAKLLQDANFDARGAAASMGKSRLSRETGVPEFRFSAVLVMDGVICI